MALDYPSYVAELLVLTQFNAGDPNFTTNLPNAIDYATQRINRELNLLNTVVSDTSLALTAGVRSLDISGALINVVQDVNMITPAGTTDPEAGTRVPLTISDKSFLNLVYGSLGTPAIPANFAFMNNTTLIFGPWPDGAYTVELVGTMYPEILSADTPNTWVATYLPDLFIAASMIFMSGYMKNFGSQADDPKMAMSWETQYTSLRDSAGVEDARRRFVSIGYTSELPGAYNPPRT